MGYYDETIFHIWRIMEKRCYYLMSAAGASIGYGIATIDSNVSITDQRLLTAGLIVLAFSFFAGLYTISNLKSVVKLFSSTPMSLAKSEEENPNIRTALISNIEKFSGQLHIRNKLSSGLQITFLSFGTALLAATKINFFAVFGGSQ